MADNVTIKNSNNVDVVTATKDIGGVQFRKTIAVDGNGDEIAAPLTNAQLRAAAIAVALDGASLAALENITASLDVASLAALENIVVSGQIELGATSLAALEAITATGPLTDTQLRAAAIAVILDNASLAALENITATLDAGSLSALENITVGGTVELGATSLAALESITASGPLTDAQLRAQAVLVALPRLPAGVNRSGTITAGGTAQELAPANVLRNALKGQNISAGDLWISEITSVEAALNTSGSYQIAPGEVFEIQTNQVIRIWGATTGQKFTATET